MLTRPAGGDLTIWFDGRPIQARTGDSIAVALLAAGVTTTRTTPVSGARRGPYCLMGACFECLANVDGRANVQTCMTPVGDGMQVRLQEGARTLPTTAAEGPDVRRLWSSNDKPAQLFAMESKKSPWFIAIGASGAEGLDDIRKLLSALPPAFPAVILVVLHRQWDHPSHLAAILARACRLPVVVASQGERLEAGTVYIGAPAEHLTLAASSFGEIIDDPGRLYGNRTVDLLFKSVAAHAGNRMIGVVLSGALDDGSRGLAAIHKAGGVTMVLTPTHQPHRGMPENAISYDGPIDLIGDPQRIAKGICTACAPSEP